MVSDRSVAELLLVRRVVDPRQSLGCGRELVEEVHLCVFCVVLGGVQALGRLEVVGCLDLDLARVELVVDQLLLTGVVVERSL